MTDVSLIIPAHNAASTIIPLLDSLAGEAAVIAEIILVDDASSDGLAMVAEKHARSLSLPLRVIRVEFRDSGAARNAGLAEASAPWVYFIDADDLHVAGGLRRMVACAKEQSTADLVVGAYMRRVDGIEHRIKRPARFDPPGVVNAERYLTGEARSIAIGSALVRRAAIGDARFPQAMPYDEDTIFWAEILVRAHVVTIDDLIMIYVLSTRRADDRFARQPARNFLRWRRSLLPLLDQGISRLAIARRQGIVALKIARVHYARGDFKTAERFMVIVRAAPKFPAARLRTWRYDRKLALRRLLRASGHRDD